ncbi:MAG TPA: helix-turn-helix domain-containing protein [Actinomycetota bacterium]|jgi:AcrR family transcriptional regulator|nr:helix-turn-helix domain-containing protein [Actinomycetota bacterium]
MTEHSLSAPPTGTRAQLVDAAERVLRTRGLARATTKEIAREAGLAEGTLYLHFADKLDLVRAVHERLLPAFIEVVRHLPARAGSGTVEGNLTELARSALRLYRDVLPLGSSLFADPELLRRYRALLAGKDGGPHRAWEPVIAYLRAEQRLGRVAADADPAAAVLLLLGACQQLVFVELMTGPATLPFRDRPDPAAALVATLLTGLAPTQPSDRIPTEPSP